MALGEDSLKDLCSDYFKLGCGIYGYNMETNAINHKEYMEVAKKHFNSCTLTNLMKPVYVLSEYDSIDNFESGNSEPVLNFQVIEDTLKWCKENNVQMRGHTLVWHTQAPRWFFCQGYDSSNNLVGREEMIERLDSFTKQYMGYVQEKFPGVVYCWDVVNEAVIIGEDEDGNPVQTTLIEVLNNFISRDEAQEFINQGIVEAVKDPEVISQISTNVANSQEITDKIYEHLRWKHISELLKPASV